MLSYVKIFLLIFCELNKCLYLYFTLSVAVHLHNLLRVYTYSLAHWDEHKRIITHTKIYPFKLAITAIAQIFTIFIKNINVLANTIFFVGKDFVLCFPANFSVHLLYNCRRIFLILSFFSLVISYLSVWLVLKLFSLVHG